MTAATPLPNALAAAHRARTLANLARGRAALHPARDTLLTIADRLDVAALAFETEPPPVVYGMTVTNSIPADARFALIDAASKVVDNPRTGFPVEFGQYVTQPVFPYAALKLPDPLEPVSPTLADQEAQLVAALGMVHDQLATASTPELTAALLKAAFSLHGKLARLADVVRVDNARACNQPTATCEPLPAPAAEQPAAPTPEKLDLTGLTPYTIGIIELAKLKGLRPTWGHPRGKTRRIVLTAVGPHGASGSIQIGHKSGKVLRGELIQDGGKASRAEGTNAVRKLLKALPADTCPEGCTAPTSAACARTNRP